jgi:REP element-mobilizing transposase RayT
MSKMPEPEDFPEDEIIFEVYLHIIFWTKGLQPALTPEMLAGAREAMDQAMFTVEGEALAAGGAADHLHILARLSPNHSIAKVLETLRRQCAAWTDKDRDGKDSAWQEDEVAVTIGVDELASTSKYMDRQAQYHKGVTFRSELTGILDANGIEYDEHELWG